MNHRSASKCQVVPALASAVHGVTEELPMQLEHSFVELTRSRSLSSSNGSSHHAPRSHSSMSQPVDVRKAFAYFDKNHDGKLTIKEFRSVMQDLGYKPADKILIRQMFAEANHQKNSQTLTYDDFVEFLQSKLSSPSDYANRVASPKMTFDVETLFNCYDLDKNGFIEPKELRKVMKRLTGEKLSKEDIVEMINAADQNGDGLLDKSEFAHLCRAF